MMRVHDGGVLCTIVIGIVDSISRASAALWAAVIGGYCNGYTPIKDEELINSVKKYRANSCQVEF